MDLALLVQAVEYPAGGKLAIDRDGNRWSDVAVDEQLLIDSGKAFAEMPDKFANRRSGNLNALKALSEFSEKRGDDYDGHCKNDKGAGIRARPLLRSNLINLPLLNVGSIRDASA